MTLTQAINEMTKCEKLLKAQMKLDSAMSDFEDKPQISLIQYDDFVYKYVEDNIAPYIDIIEISNLHWALKSGKDYFVSKYPQYANVKYLIEVMINNINDYLIYNNIKI